MYIILIYNYYYDIELGRYCNLQYWYIGWNNYNYWAKTGTFSSSRYWALWWFWRCANKLVVFSEHGISHLHKRQITVVFLDFSIFLPHITKCLQTMLLLFLLETWSILSFNWSCAHAWHVGVNWMNKRKILRYPLDGIDIITLSQWSIYCYIVPALLWYIHVYYSIAILLLHRTALTW